MIGWLLWAVGMACMFTSVAVSCYGMHVLRTEVDPAHERFDRLHADGRLLSDDTALCLIESGEGLAHSERIGRWAVGLFVTATALLVLVLPVLVLT